jgi:hypothetical protein
MQYFRRQSKTAILLLLCLCLISCAPLIGPYSPTAYQNATDLKAETLALMDKAATPYSENEKQVEALMVDINKAYEYVHGIHSNDLSARQWEILKRTDGALLGRFWGRWKSEGTLKRVYIDEFRGLVSDAFDEIICLEANKKEAKKCLKQGDK